MIETFEFTDGSHYEFERFQLDDRKRLTSSNRYSGVWYMHLIDEADLRNPDARSVRGCLIHFMLMLESKAQFVKKFGTLDGRNHQYQPKKYNKGEVNTDVIGVGLTHKFVAGDSEDFTELISGVYLPIKFDIRVSGRLFIDLNTIKNKAIYEPTLITEKAKRALHERTL